jgi:hypothetical protein
MVFNMIFEWLLHLCTPHIQLSVRCVQCTRPAIGVASGRWDKDIPTGQTLPNPINCASPHGPPGCGLLWQSLGSNPESGGTASTAMQCLKPLRHQTDICPSDCQMTVPRWMSLNSSEMPFCCQCLSMEIAWRCARFYTPVKNRCGWNSQIHGLEGVSIYFCIHSVALSHFIFQ